MDMNKMIFITGFARGGTSWLRDCVAAHPDVAKIPHEMVLFRNFKGSRQYVQQEIDKAVSELDLHAPYYVNKAPANAPFLGQAARAFPESRFIFIIRDPRDVFISHKRGTKKWMGGENKTVQGCMQKTQKYYQGWVEARDLPNVLLVRYEDLHQNFKQTMSNVFQFLELPRSEEILQKVYQQTNFTAQTSRGQNQEQRNSAKRKGVIGDWNLYLEEQERSWYLESRFWSDFFKQHSYPWRLNTYENILQAMYEANAHFLNEQELLQVRLDSDKPNIAVQHDIDYLHKDWCKESVLLAAEVEGKHGIPAHYNLLPLNDPRYGKKGHKIVPELVQRIKELNPRAGIGLHVNACERFYPAHAPCAGEKPEKLQEILDLLHRQIQSYQELGIQFRIATAHGYGRGKKLPNNRDTEEIAQELAKWDIRLFDADIRSSLRSSSPFYCALTDVGGVIKPKRLPGGFDLVDPRCYASIPAGGVLRFLTHPGNYPVHRPSTVSMRVERFG